MGTVYVKYKGRMHRMHADQIGILLAMLANRVEKVEVEFEILQEIKRLHPKCNFVSNGQLVLYLDEYTKIDGTLIIIEVLLQRIKNEISDCGEVVSELILNKELEAPEFYSLYKKGLSKSFILQGLEIFLNIIHEDD